MRIYSRLTTNIKMPDVSPVFLQLVRSHTSIVCKCSDHETTAVSISKGVASCTSMRRKKTVGVIDERRGPFASGAWFLFTLSLGVIESCHIPRTRYWCKEAGPRPERAPAHLIYISIPWTPSWDNVRPTVVPMVYGAPNRVLPVS